MIRYVNYSTAPRPKRCGFKFEKNSRKLCDAFETKTFQTLDRAAAQERDGGPGVDGQSDGRAEGPAHERMPHQRWNAIE